MNSIRNLLKNALLSIFCMGCAVSAHAATVDLVTNGGFESGNSGFSTDLTYSPTDLFAAGIYGIADNPNAVHGSFASFGDHTSGAGNMMVLNGTTTNGTVAWEQTVSVLGGKTYDFSIWLANAFSSGSSQLGLVVDGTTIASATTASGTTGVWNQFVGSWLASSDGDVAIQIIENSSGFVGNDYALDDISFTTEMSPVSTVPLPASALLLGAGLAGLFGFGRGRKA